jgi:DNA-binding protein Fis
MKKNYEGVQDIQFPTSLPTIKQVTWQLVEEAMKRADRNQSAAAKMLGISQQALSKRLKNSPKN